MPNRVLLAAIVFLLPIGVTQAGYVVSGSIYPTGQGAVVTVDRWGFHVNSNSTITMDVLSWEGGNHDVNGDGEIAYFDAVIMLFRDDGNLGVDDFIATADDRHDSNGNLTSFDPYLQESLAPGDYLLAISSYAMRVEDAITDENGFNIFEFPWGPGSAGSNILYDHGDYQITFSGDLTLTRDPRGAILTPEPSSIALFCCGLGIVYTGFRWKNWTRIK